MADVFFSQSGGELRIQDEAAVKPRNEVPGFQRSLFWARKLPTGFEGLGSVLSFFLSDSSDMSIENQSIHM